MKIINPVLLDRRRIENISKEIIGYNRGLIFDPIKKIYQEIFNHDLKLNGISYLRGAIQTEQVVYKNGYFIGKINSNILKDLKSLGAVYIPERGWRVPVIPEELQNTIEEKHEKAKDVANEVIQYLDSLPALPEVDVPLNYAPTLENYSEQIKSNFDAFNIQPNLEGSRYDDLNGKYVENTKRYIRGWLPQDIQKLRHDMEYYILDQGYNQRKIAELIQDQYRVTAEKSIFLARQESSLLMVEYTKSVYTDSDIREGKWRTAGGEKVRESHRKLEGLIFFLNDPPIIDEKGTRGFPGEAFNCRCSLLPIIR